MTGGLTRRLLISAMTDLIKTMDEPKWDELASAYLLRKMEEHGVVISVREGHTLNELDEVRVLSQGPGPQTPPSSVGRHGGKQP